MAKFFDSLGWATPVSIIKILMQRLWTLQCRWDEIPSQFLDCWSNYHQRFLCFNAISILRWTTYRFHTLLIFHCVLHRFSDASAFAAAVYLRTINIDGSITVSLLAAKSKMGPLKTISVPWLELSTALLLARLIHFAQRSNFRTSSVTAGRTSPLHSPGWVSHLPDGKPLLPFTFRLCNHSFPEFRGVMFRRTPIPRTARLAVSLLIFSRHMLYGGHALHGYIILPSSGRPRALRYSPMFLSNNTQNLQYVPCTLRPIGISRLFFVIKIATNYRLSVPFSKSTPTL